MSPIALSYRDYTALPADGRRYQILDGELCVTPAPGTRHQEIVANLGTALHAHVRAHGLGKVYFAPVDVILSDSSIVQPDIVLAIEVLSPTTTNLDRRRKRELYARHSVPYYWIVDGDERTIEMYRLAGEVYELVATEAGDSLIAVDPVPGLALTDIWP